MILACRTALLLLVLLLLPPTRARELLLVLRDNVLWREVERRTKDRRRSDGGRGMT